MPFPESDALKSTINNLRDIITRSHSENKESAAALSQIESIVSDIERKASGQQQSFVGSSTVPVSV
jgi:hypothetical protein